VPVSPPEPPSSVPESSPGLPELAPELVLPELLVPELVLPELLVPELVLPELLVPELLVPFPPEDDDPFGVPVVVSVPAAQAASATHERKFQREPHSSILMMILPAVSVLTMPQPASQRTG
jgi:hypothetical protein